MRALVLLVFALFLLSDVAPPASPTVVINTRPLALDPADPGRRQVGALDYLGGLILSSSDPRFGGFSSMHVVGERFMLMSDTGQLTRVAIDRRWRLGPARMDAMEGLGTRGLKWERDIEAMAVDPATGTFWVALENTNRIVRYGHDLNKQAEAAPAAMAKWSANGGAESMIRTTDGRFILISEEASRSDGAHPALIFDRDPTDPAAVVTEFGYRPPDDSFHPTDALALPDGRLLILNRRFSLLQGVAAALMLVDPAGDGFAAGVEIARLEPPLSVDNMEAMALTQEGDRSILWLLSDDNLSQIQRTLLMKFALRLPPR
jgi:hypothetical protein